MIIHSNRNYCCTTVAVLYPHCCASLDGYAAALTGGAPPRYASDRADDAVPPRRFPQIPEAVREGAAVIPSPYRGHVVNQFLVPARRGLGTPSACLAWTRSELSRLARWHEQSGNRDAAAAYHLALSFADTEQARMLAEWAVTNSEGGAKR